MMTAAPLKWHPSVDRLPQHIFVRGYFVGHWSSPSLASVVKKPKKLSVRASSSGHGTCFAPAILISAAGLCFATNAAYVSSDSMISTVESAVP